MDRLLIFGDNSLDFPQILLPRVHAVVAGRDDISICGVVDTTKRVPAARVIRILKVLAVSLAKKLFNPDQKLDWKRVRFDNLSDTCARLNIQVIVPPRRDINDREFVDFVRESIRPTMGLAIGCLQIFQSDLIALFDILVNYHNGLLPAYPGLRATSWSVYFAETHTGYTFHRINEVIDGGNILLQKQIPISGKIPPGDLDQAKTVNAAENIATVLDQMIARAKGTPQSRERVYFGKKKYEAVTSIDDPADVTLAELERRLFAFGNLKIKIRGVTYPVTRITSGTAASLRIPKLSFISKDRLRVKPLRFQHLPFMLYTLYRFFDERMRSGRREQR